MVPRRLSVPAQDGDEADIGDLYRRHAETVARWVSRLGGPLVDVEDLVHEVFLVAQRKRPSNRGSARITTWLYRVTAKVVSHRRRKDRWRRWLRGSPTDTAGGLPSSEPSPIEALEARERAALTYRVLDRLPERQRAVLILFEMEGLPGEEIAAYYDAKVTTVWVWLHRARAAVLAELVRIDGKGERP
jgi:RNA polymerase sigma-70 factor (ECF subfamily)